MALPKIDITIKKGGLGLVPSSNDGICALLITGTKKKMELAALASASPIEKSLYTKGHRIGSLTDLERLKEIPANATPEAIAKLHPIIRSEDYPKVYAQIKDFYTAKGAALWIRLLPTDAPFTAPQGSQAKDAIFDAGGIAEQLSIQAAGQIRLLGVSHLEKTNNTVKAAADGFKGGIHAAVPLAQGFADSQRTEVRPLHVFLAGHEVSAIADLTGFAEATHNRVSVLISGKTMDSATAALGLVLGRLSTLPVQRSLARVKNGSLNISQATIATSTTAIKVEDVVTSYSDLHTKRFLFFRKYTGRSGYYVADDLTACVETDDTATIANGRVLDKAIRLTYATYIDEIAEEVTIQEDGTLDPAHIAYLEGKIENVINETMTNAGELSSIQAVIDPTQNILSTSKLNIELSLVPVGYTKIISIQIGFTNPALTNNA